MGLLPRRPARRRRQPKNLDMKRSARRPRVHAPPTTGRNPLVWSDTAENSVPLRYTLLMARVRGEVGTALLNIIQC